MIWKLLLLLSATSCLATDWPGWRGELRDNKASKNASPVSEWSEEKNVRWKTSIPGRGHSTPIVVGKRIYLTTGDAKKGTQSLLSLERKTGKTLWEKVIHTGGLAPKIHQENSHASPTPQWDGKHVLTTFQNDDKIKITAVSPEGKIVWSKSVGSYLPSYEFGYGSTPTLYKGLLIVAADTPKTGYITAIESSTGKERWRTPRTDNDNWATPVVAKVSGKEQLLVSGMGRISSYEPLTGKPLWTAPLEPLATCGTVVWTEDMVFASGGYPKNQTAGIKADGSGTVVWKNRERCYEQSLLSHNGLIFGVTDKGTAFCWRASDGERLWKERLGRGGVMASPTLAGDLVYATIKTGKTTVFKASGESFQKVAENQLGTDTYASPVMVDDELYLRVGERDSSGARQEILYCLGK